MVNKVFMGEEDISNESYVQGYSKGVDDTVNKINEWFFDLNECHLPNYLIDTINHLKEEI